MSEKTLYDKLWDRHVVRCDDDGTCLLYIDRHLVHEVTSPQAFEGLRLAGRQPWRAEANLAVPDHNVPTTDRSQGITDPLSRLQADGVPAPFGQRRANGAGLAGGATANQARAGLGSDELIPGYPRGQPPQSRLRQRTQPSSGYGGTRREATDRRGSRPLLSTWHSSRRRLRWPPWT